MNEIDRAIHYFSNLEKTYNEQLEKCDNPHYRSLTTISRDMFKAGKEALQEKQDRENSQPLFLEQLKVVSVSPCGEAKISNTDEYFMTEPIYDHEAKEQAA